MVKILREVLDAHYCTGCWSCLFLLFYLLVGRGSLCSHTDLYRRQTYHNGDPSFVWVHDRHRIGHGDDRYFISARRCSDILRAKPYFKGLPSEGLTPSIELGTARLSIPEVGRAAL